MPTNEELQGLLNVEQLSSNIMDKQGKIDKYRAGIECLKKTANLHDPYIIGRIAFLESKILDYEEAISTWKALLTTIPKNT